MYTLASCILMEHDLWLVAVAVAVCAAGAALSVRLLQRTFASPGLSRFAWVIVGAIVSGSTAWCTHFVAMLAYRPGVGVSYDPVLTLLSLLLAILGATAAFAMAIEKIRFAPALGGAIFGGVVAAMHYTGMAALTINAVVVWDPAFLAGSLLAAIPVASAAFHIAAGATSLQRLGLAAVIMALAIASLHFTGMAAIGIAPGPHIGGPSIDETARTFLAFSVTVVGILIFSVGIGVFILDRQSEAAAAARLNHLTESAVDGMAVASRGVIIAVNAAFEDLAARPRSALVGAAVDTILPGTAALPEGTIILTEIRPPDAAAIPVELTIHREPVRARRPDLRKTQQQVAGPRSTGRDALVPPPAHGGSGEALTVYALRDIRHRLEQEHKIAYLARFDSLTGLLNRTSFLEDAETMIRHRGDEAVLFVLDLEHFKDINELYGQSLGDEVLRHGAERMRALFGPAVTGARIGGDEFAVLALIPQRDGSAADVNRIARTLRGIFSGVVAPDEEILDCRAHVGIALRRDARDEPLATFLNHATVALEFARAAGEPVAFYDKGMDDLARRRRTFVKDMTEAIATDALELHYQVQVSLTDETPTGYEALVRWVHPERGMILPNEFIAQAEDTGLIVDMGLWVLRTACREAARWAEPHTIAVNLSPAQLGNPGLLPAIIATLKETGLPPARLELEVTETCFAHDNAAARAILDTIRDLGVSISIDDFGSGYSSIGLLRTFPFDKIKLDKTLVDDIGEDVRADGVLAAVMSLGKAFDVPILAEGVERPEQAAHLKAAGCSFVQGYLYGQPEKVPGAVTYRGGKRGEAEPGPVPARRREALRTAAD
ncbi:putative bifunctional diguanylate cyclase/phosphodiesterase [Acuticoccus yangtzensis]|uniref:putative bifunctional diguanylate cyclase/phosphodiesterase n=1 Tax=Acuticoccus yangtzensis TaxID=1443441 RepID=UPI0009496ADB|nr:EAL domain-containing protein [Acuticoccus yangtzensis]